MSNLPVLMTPVVPNNEPKLQGALSQGHFIPPGGSYSADSGPMELAAKGELRFTYETEKIETRDPFGDMEEQDKKELGSMRDQQEEDELFD